MNGVLRSDMCFAREHRASESIPEKALRRRKVGKDLKDDDDVEVEQDEDPSPHPSRRLNFRTSSSTSSSQRLSLSPSEARMRISSARMGRVNVCG